MKVIKNLVGILLLSIMAMSICLGQETKEQEPYNDCAAIFFKGQMLVDTYSPSGKCVLDSKSKGELTLFTVSLSDHGNTKVLGLPFRVAIRNERTSTYWMYSKELVKSLRLEDVVAECEEGDKLIFLTEDKKYALPHGEVELIYSSR